MSSTIQVRVDDELKSQSDQLFKDLGTDTTSAIRIFLTQAVARGGFPFEIRRVDKNPYAPMSEERMMKKLEDARNSAEEGRCRTAEDVDQQIRQKYGL